MTYFKDLTHFEYHKHKKYPANYLNVGWLSKKRVFPTGLVSDRFQFNLEQLCKNQATFALGRHYCEFCKGSPDDNSIHDSGWEKKLREKWSDGEIFVNGENGEIYVAPILIYHYVKEHRYQPSEEFIKAVESAIKQ